MHQPCKCLRPGWTGHSGIDLALWKGPCPWQGVNKMVLRSNPKHSVNPSLNYLSSFSSAWILSAWYLCSSFFTRDKYSCAHFFNTSSFLKEKMTSNLIQEVKMQDRQLFVGVKRAVWRAAVQQWHPTEATWRTILHHAKSFTIFLFAFDSWLQSFTWGLWFVIQDIRISWEHKSCLLLSTTAHSGTQNLLSSAL